MLKRVMRIAHYFFFRDKSSADPEDSYSIPVQIEVGGQIVTLHEDGAISGDFHRFENYLKFKLQKSWPEERLLYWLILTNWRQQLMAVGQPVQQHLEPAPKRATFPKICDNWKDTEQEPDVDLVERIKVALPSDPRDALMSLQRRPSKAEEPLKVRVKAGSRMATEVIPSVDEIALVGEGENKRIVIQGV